MSTKRPDAVSAVTSEALDVLERYTMFPWPLLRTQAERAGLDPAQLDVAGLTRIVADVQTALVRFTSEQKAARARVELDLLVGRMRT